MSVSGVHYVQHGMWRPMCMLGIDSINVSHESNLLMRDVFHLLRPVCHQRTASKKLPSLMDHLSNQLSDQMKKMARRVGAPIAVPNQSAPDLRALGKHTKASDATGARSLPSPEKIATTIIAQNGAFSVARAAV